MGWKVGTSVTTNCVLNALEQAIHARRTGTEADLVPSVDSISDGYDNA